MDKSDDSAAVRNWVYRLVDLIFRGQYIPKGALVIFDGLNKELCVGIHLVLLLFALFTLVGNQGGCSALYILSKQLHPWWWPMVVMNSFILTMRYQFLSLGPVTLGSFRLIIGVWFWRRMRKRTCWWSFIKKDSLCQRSLLWQRRLINQRFLQRSPPDKIDEVVGLVGSIKENFNRLISRYAPWIKRIPLEQGLRFEPEEEFYFLFE